MVQASVSGFAAKSRVTRGQDRRDRTVFVSRSEPGTVVESNQAVCLLPTVRAPSNYLLRGASSKEYEYAWIGEENAGIRTIGRVPAALVVVYIHARSGTWVIRPARVENALVFVLP
jgi:hypothetical protein